ncbi:DUF4198 domain-containing protein [Niabella beijingensis]|uniref:DUF4198 domain-containing protein n=1 Tax=Niabella beijingensis TaxID=2872700 RepID=UPI001CC05EF2|nr:DUF4198 domain-containing protein [Niabella beijingensis]MBZ4191884.1 DUF4198 domain-containing protein [Niabella beijingensis]
MLLRKLLTLLLIMLVSQVVLAHAIWVETRPTGNKDQAHEIKVYFGEYGDNDITPAEKWFSDLKAFSLEVIAPDGTAEKLSATAAEDHYRSSFTPRQEGVYTVVLHHPVKDFYHGMQLKYNSGATVKIGNSDTGNQAAVNKNQLSIFTDNASAAVKNQPVKTRVLFDGKPAAQKEVQVFAPNGWSKTLYTDKEGMISFTPLWEGKYMVEFSHTDEKGGETDGRKFEKTFNAATALLFVK